MEDILLKLPEYFNIVSEWVFTLCLLATAIVRIPGVDGDKEVSHWTGKLGKWIGWAAERLPTLGLNPKNKKLKEKLDSMRE